MSSLVKSEVRINTAQEIGVRMDDALEAAKSDISRCDGAGSMATRIAVEIEGLCAAVQKEIDAGKLDMDMGSVAVSWLMKAKAAASNQALGSHQAKAMAQGRVMAFEQSVALVSKFKSDEENKVRAVLAAAAAEDVSAEDVGPRPTIKQQYAAEDARLAQEAARAAAPVGKKAAKRAKNTR